MRKLLATAAFLLASTAAQAQYTFEYGGRTIRIDPDRGTVQIPGVYDNTGQNKPKKAKKNETAPQQATVDPQAPAAPAPPPAPAAPARSRAGARGRRRAASCASSADGRDCGQYAGPNGRCAAACTTSGPCAGRAASRARRGPAARPGRGCGSASPASATCACSRSR
ncbi:pyruvate/2-oxoglutarate dehydrogenase complex dihydrolipoamide acyltransferase (E2) component [Bradyrhizobium sp. USDA 336]